MRMLKRLKNEPKEKRWNEKLPSKKKKDSAFSSRNSRRPFSEKRRELSKRNLSKRLKKDSKKRWKRKRRILSQLMKIVIIQRPSTIKAQKKINQVTMRMSALSIQSQNLKKKRSRK